MFDCSGKVQVCCILARLNFDFWASLLPYGWPYRYRRVLEFHTCRCYSGLGAGGLVLDPRKPIEKSTAGSKWGFPLARDVSPAARILIRSLQVPFNRID